MSDRSWRSRTEAQLQRPSDLRRSAKAVGATLIGVVGYSGSWTHNPRPDAEQVALDTLGQLFDEAMTRFDTVWCVSGATDLGVPGLAYRAANARSLCTVGITAASAITYPLARLDRLVVVGQRFGDESAVFVAACDEVWMLGGGPQSEAEVLAAAQVGTPLQIVTGLGGAAERLDPADVPTATWRRV